MNGDGENEALLVKHNMLDHTIYRGDGSSTGEESGSRSDGWCESGSTSDSSCSSSCSDSGSFVSSAEWESSVNANGELFFIKSQLSSESHGASAPDIDAPELTRRTRISPKGKLARLIRRRNSKRQDLKPSSTITTNETSTANAQSQSEPARIVSANKVTFQDWQEGEVREVTMCVDPRGQSNLGRRATLCETLLGLVVSTFSDQSRIMVAGFIPNGEAIRYKSIKIGDWLRCINDQEISFTTVDSILETIVSPCKVKLTLQRVDGCEVTTPLPPMKQQKAQQSELASLLVAPEVFDMTQNIPFGVLYVMLDGLTEGGPMDQGILYCYPHPANKNILAATRGCFLTLYHIFSDMNTSKPVSSSVILNGQLFHIIFKAENRELMFLGLPNCRCSLQEALQVTSDVVLYLLFAYQTLSRCFSVEENHRSLDKFFSLFFSRIMGNKLLDYSRLLDTSGHDLRLPQWESVLLAAHYVPLPKDGQILLDEILSELESNDLGDMSDDYGFQRMFSIIGSCFYHQGYLLASHLARSDLIDVHSFCRQRGLLHLTRIESQDSIVLWQEVFPSSCHRGLSVDNELFGSYQLPQGKWFLLIVGEAQDMLAVLLEAGGCTVSPEEFTRPDMLCVEHAQETLTYIQKVGIPVLADKWLSVSVRPQVVTPHTVSNTKASPKRLGFSWPSDSALSNKLTPPSGGSGSSGSPISKKPLEVTSILKRRASPDRFFNSGISSHGSISEDSASQSASIQSEVSDETAPVLGRRAEREKISHYSSDNSSSLSRVVDLHSDHSEDSDSDWESYKDPNQQDSSFDISDMKQELLTDVEDILPARLTAGERNVLFHYVHFDVTEGILLSPPIKDKALHSRRYVEVLSNFRQSCYFIHNLLQNTVCFKKQAGLENSLFINKSLIAVKEHGILFECSVDDDSSKRNPAGSLTYWVVGRLFFTPYPREVYVCYQDSAPQNMVEIAFRLALSACG